MHRLRTLACLLLIPLAALANERTLKIDRSRSFVDVDVKVTVDSFTGRLEAYDARIAVDENGKIKSAVFEFGFGDLKTGKTDRDEDMIKWLGGGAPSGRFELGALALTPDGQGHATGRLTFHGSTNLIEFPVNVTRLDGAYTISGSATVDYTNWGLKVLRKMALVKVDPEVKVRFKLVGTPVEPAG